MCSKHRLHALNPARSSLSVIILCSTADRLYAIVLGQSFYYFRAFPDDSVYMKMAVRSLCRGLCCASLRNFRWRFYCTIGPLRTCTVLRITQGRRHGAHRAAHDRVQSMVLRPVLGTDSSQVCVLFLSDVYSCMLTGITVN